MSSYLAIDLGGTKTLIAVFDSEGNVVDQVKFPTNPDYSVFLREVEKNVANLSTNTNIACAVAVPGLIDRDAGVVESLGNLGWRNKPLRADLAKIVGDMPIILENDSRTAGLAEASQLVGQYEYVLYLTISTGIGGALLQNGKIIEALQDAEVGHMPLMHQGKIQIWESFASGRALVKQYNKQASEITEAKTWQQIGNNIAYGVAICCSIMQPEAIVFGGGVGQYANKFLPHVEHYLKEHADSLVSPPKALLTPAFADNSAIHGCFILLQQHGLVK